MVSVISQETADEEPHPQRQRAMNVAAAALLQPLSETGARPLPASLDGFLAQVERRAWRVAEMGLNDREEALDAVQDAMLRLVRSYRERPPEEWSPLFWGILRRRITDLQRRRKVRSIVVGWLAPRGGDEDGDDGPLWEPADLAPDPQQRLLDSSAYAAMGVAVRKLPRRQQEAFMLRMLEGLDVAATAQAMGCSAGSVKTHLSRAMEALRNHLEDWR